MDGGLSPLPRVDTQPRHHCTGTGLLDLTNTPQKTPTFNGGGFFALRFDALLEFVLAGFALVGQVSQ
jgi:hypothetical protein